MRRRLAYTAAFSSGFCFQLRRPRFGSDGVGADPQVPKRRHRVIAMIALVGHQFREVVAAKLQSGIRSQSFELTGRLGVVA